MGQVGGEKGECPLGWKMVGKECVKRCPNGKKWTVIEPMDMGKPTVTSCEWKDDDSRCAAEYECPVGKEGTSLKAMGLTTCTCERKRDFDPTGVCSSTEFWDYYKWKCLPAAKCPAFRPCNYGLFWDADSCECKRKSWCPVTKKCQYGEYWKIDKCECRRHKWCPTYRTCH
jgi:hypothetical protein